MIPRGGKVPNYSAVDVDVDAACALLKAAGEVAAQIAGGDARITGIMIESHLSEGRRDIRPGTPLKHGVSVTDACTRMGPRRRWSGWQWRCAPAGHALETRRTHYGDR